SNVLVLTYWNYDDPLIQTYTLPYLRLISRRVRGTLFLVMLERDVGSISRERRQKILDELREDRIVPLLLRYRRFGTSAIVGWIYHIMRLAWFIRSHDVEVIHAWCTPAGAVGACLAKLTGRRLVLDSFEPHAQAMVENGTWRDGGAAFRILFWMERWQARRADALIGLVEDMKDYARRIYGVVDKPFWVKPALVDLATVPRMEETDRRRRREALGLQDKVVCVYAGKTGGIYYGRELFDLLKAAEGHWGGRFRALVLSPTPERELREYARQSGLAEDTLIVRCVPHREVYSFMALADFAVNPVKPVPSKRYCTSIKDGEYWALGLPVVIPPGISDDSEIIQTNRSGVIWEDTSPEGCKKAILGIEELLREPRAPLRERIQAQAWRYRRMALGEAVYDAVYGEA
ncbi:MAG: glycosyltransferase, partial [Candidatus Binatia bacterium]